MRILIVCLAVFYVTPSWAKLQVFACEPEWGALANIIGGDQVHVFNATTGLQDPHHVQARPSLIAKMRQADLVFCTGAELEIGWLPILLNKAGKTSVQPGELGMLFAADYVNKLEIPVVVDRKQGDIHSSGNPHIQLDPRNFLPVARELASRLTRLDSKSTPIFAGNLESFEKSWQKSIDRWQAAASDLRGRKVVVYHRHWSYLLHWLGMVSVADVEPKPGVPPSAKHLVDTIMVIEQKNPFAILYSSFAITGPVTWLQQNTEILAVELPATLGSVPGTDTLPAFFEVIVGRLNDAAAQ